MKKMKNLLALLLAAILVVGSVFSASAADITMSGAQEGHDYEAYQIFAGTVTKDPTSGEITGISITGWGNGITDGAAFLAALKADPTVGALFANPSATPAVNVQTAEAAAKVVSGMGHDQLVAFARVASQFKNATNKKTATEDPAGTYKWTGLDDGYWLVLDETTGLTDENDFISANILHIAGENVTVSVKGSGTTSDKGVSDAATAPTTFVEVNNVHANIGDKVYFTLKGTTSGYLNHYNEYEWTFVDTLPTGITFYQIENVYVGGTAIPQTDWATYTVTVTEPANKATSEQAAGTANAPAAGGGELKVKYVLKTPLKADGTRDIDHIGNNSNPIDLLVVYSAVVNQNATQGGTYDETTNTMHAEFTNDPNGNGKGKTPDEEAVVYSVIIDLDKVSSADTNKKLPGATFLLTRSVIVGGNDVIEYAVVENGKLVRWSTTKADATELTTGPEGGTYKPIQVAGLEGGIVTKDPQTGKETTNPVTYVLYEIKAPEGYNQPTVPHNDGGKEVPSNFSVTLKITATGNDVSNAGLSDLNMAVTYTGVANAVATNAKVTGYEKYTSVPAESLAGANPATEGWYEKNGETYTVTTDTEAATGKTYYTKEVLTDANTGNGSVSLGQAEGTISNSNQLTLPSTGGAGRTMFYLIGAILVLGCAVLFVSKRRVNG